MFSLYRFSLPLVVAVLGLALVAGITAQQFLTGWFLRDVELRSELIFNSVEPAVRRQAADSDEAGLGRTFDGISRDERVLAIGLCDAAGRMVAASRNWPGEQICRDEKPAAGAERRGAVYERRQLSSGPVLIAGFPLAIDPARNWRLMVLHDMGFASSRTTAALTTLVAFVGLLIALGVLITVAVTRVTLSTWSRAIVQSLDPRTRSRPEADIAPELRPVVREVRQTLRDIDIGRVRGSPIRVSWTSTSLQEVIHDELPGSEVIVVSNREPYIHDRDGDRIIVRRPASGLVTALEPIIRATRGVWIAHGSGSADRETVNASDRVAVPPEDPAYTLRRVWLTEEEENGYYYRFSNEGLWPLCHIAFVRPQFRREDWEIYRAVNQRFADTIVAEAKSKNPIVFVQDYHFALLPRMIRQRLPEATVITFWHIPWPNAEVFSICPWREEILDGLLGSSILGFHTRFHVNNFIESVDRFMESHIDRELSTISTGGEATLVNAYPISIEWPPRALLGLPTVGDCRRRVREQLGLGPDVKIGVGVERFDYTKGIPDRLRAVGILLERHPEWIGRFVFIQVAAPTRAKLDAYRGLQEEAMAVAETINARYARDGWKPIELIVRHHEPEEVLELFRAADFCVVTSLHDGMNLVAKEFVASREDDRGVLVLSTFAGASRELLEALLVNPYDMDTLAETLVRALSMSEEEQRDRMRLMRELVRDNNVYAWAGSMLMEAARMRKRREVQNHFGETRWGLTP
ncbi:alpha,alpha-trehalose-phosphate synthase (UDP-forming) [Prosthecomicrobium hirschii]|uniref:Alpha,alpha-trehalose-phosphate synthase n=1 Tax=Prosthecodimorpha hirschii TaxID=665126 RepID=A0A0P6VMP3_9HYPH|nr:trehalose-6-phosphate synthase [Prosthecomicrobium hirschii]KPL54000.1 alpha,alpha-trehalose-phosphate synthase [Prosthecomicrobium hirschii]MCW1841223.1 trehalose-6-phosphate synthase [Prosthecomicrobium hirschii]